MWVEAAPESFTKDEPIRIQFSHAVVYGKFLHIEADMGTRYVVYYTNDRPEAPLRAFISSARKFYKWEEPKPLDESKLRLNKPDPDRHPDTQAEVEAAEAALRDRISNLEQGYIYLAEEMSKRHTARIGTHRYTLREGEHLRAWVEDGRLYTELVQENKQ